MTDVIFFVRLTYDCNLLWSAQHVKKLFTPQVHNLLKLKIHRKILKNIYILKYVESTEYIYKILCVCVHIYIYTYVYVHILR